MDVRRGPRYGSYPRIPGADWPARRETAREFAEGELERLRDFRYYIARLGGRPAEPPDTPLGRHLELPFEDVGLGVPGNIFWSTPDGTPEGKHLRQVMMGRFLSAGIQASWFADRLDNGIKRPYDGRRAALAATADFAVTGVLPSWDGQPWRRRWLVGWVAGLYEDELAVGLDLPRRAAAELADWRGMTAKPPEAMSNFWTLFEGIRYRCKEYGPPGSVSRDPALPLESLRPRR